jgi:Ca2+-binding EF-hand superfamily protein
MARRKRRKEAQARRDRRREKTLLASKLALEKELAEEYGEGGGGAPENPLRAGLASLKSANITQEMRDQHDEMLERVALVTRVDASPRRDADSSGPEAVEAEAEAGGDGGGSDRSVAGTDAASAPLSAKELATAALLPAIPSYKNMEYEVAKLSMKQSAVMEIEVDTLPSPFLRKHMPSGWKRLTPGERLDKKTREVHEETQMMASRLVGKTSSPKPVSSRGMKGAASAPVLGNNGPSPQRTSKHAASTMMGRMERLTSALSQIESRQSASPSSMRTVNTDENNNKMRERMRAKLARFDQAMATVKATEKEAEAAERARKKLNTSKERPSLYQGYGDLFKDDETSERAKRIRLKKDEQLKKMTHFGPYTAKEVLGLRKLFNEIDDDASGQIDVDEFVNATALQGSHIFMNAASMFGSIDRDESGSISFGELLAVSFPSASSENVRDMLRFVKSHESQEHMKTKISLSNTQMDEINNIFQLYDVDSSGGVSTEELYDAMIGSNPAMRQIFSLEEMDKLVRQYDDDGNATLELEEFTKLFKDNFLEDKSAEAVAVGQRAARSSAGMRSK